MHYESDYKYTSVPLRKSKSGKKGNKMTTAKSAVTQKPRDREGTEGMNRDGQKDQETAINQWDAHVAVLRG